MDNFLSELNNVLTGTSYTELFAVVTSILYLLLAARESLWCWLFALISTALYTILLVDAQLWAETGLQAYYGVMAIYGYFNWKKHGTQSKDHHAPIEKMSISQHVVSIAGIIAGAAIMGFLLSKYTNAAMPYLDSFTTVGALVVTWMVTRKFIDNWLYWIVVDGMGVYLYFSKELYLSSVLFVAYVIIVIIGYFNWRKKLKLQLSE